MAVTRNVGRENPNLAVGDLARRAGILPRHTARGFALLQKAVRRANDSLDHSLVRLTIDHQHRIVVTEPLDNIIAHQIA